LVCRDLQNKISLVAQKARVLRQTRLNWTRPSNMWAKPWKNGTHNVC